MGEFWFWFGLVAGTILFHMLVEIIYDFDFRALFHNWKRLIVLLVLVVAGVFAFRQDLTGYDTYLPARDQIVSAGVGGYGLYDRALGAAYLNGLWEAIDKENRKGALSSCKAMS